MSQPVRTRIRQGVAEILIDNPPVNAMSSDVRQGLLAAIEAAEADPAVRAVVIRCAGRTFVAGADIREFGQPPLPPRLGDLYDRIEACPKPVVVALHGTALGGGLELALACHARVALEGTRIGLPEVQLGLIPGAGGTQRLPRLIGVAGALDLALGGEPVDVRATACRGLIDRMVPDGLVEAADALAREIAAGGADPRRTGELPVPDAQDAAPGRDAIRAKAATRSRGARAPSRIVEAVLASLEQPLADGLCLERRLFEESRADPQSAALRHLFFAERAAGKVTAAPSTVEVVGVVGAGTMGTGIAIALLDAGLTVVLNDVDQASLERGRARVASHYARQVERGRLDPARSQACLDRLSTSENLAAAARCDLVIEAIVEDLAAKQAVFRRLDAALPPSALIATNTSYLDVDQLACATQRPDRVLGMHFFSPANVMRLVEVIRAAATAADSVATAAALARRLRKIPVIVGNAPGFVGNRMLQAYGRENQLLLLEGATPWQVDAALERFGMAMGPNAVLDLAGLDIGYLARRQRKDLPDDPRYFRVADLLVERGRLGRKAGRGSYLYPGDGARRPDPEVEALIEAEAGRLGVSRRSVPDEEIVERCMLALVNEGARLLDEGIAASAADIDVVWTNGYGFPRHLGGPMWYADSLGLAEVAHAVARLAARHGTRYWTPAPLLLGLASRGGRFHAH